MSHDSAAHAPAARPGLRGRVLQGVFGGGRPRTAPFRGAAQASGAAAHSFEVPETILRRRGRGNPLPEPVLRKMESALGADFSDVRVHVGPEAVEIGALAFTHGSDIFFAPGLYDPGSPHGQRLLGHELVHVVQQRAGRVSNPFGSGVAVVQDPGLEAEAERLGMLAALQAHPAPAHGAACNGPGGRPCFGPGGETAAQPRTVGGRSLAPHVAAAVGAAPARTPQGAPGVTQARAGERGAGGGSAAAAPASHVQAALATHHHHPPARSPRATAAPVQARTAPSRQAAAPGYRLIVGTYLHRTGGGEVLPEDLAGHTFVAVQEPSGRRHAWGFSPDRYGDYDPQRDLGRLNVGVQGKVHDDERALREPGVRVRSFDISREQAESALAKVAEYRARGYDFKLQQRACSSFALDVARAADVDPFPGSKVVRPRQAFSRL